MRQLTTKQALKQLLTDEDYLLRFMQAGYSKDDRSRLKRRFMRGKLSLEKQDEVLQRCGYTVVIEKQWLRP